MTKKQIAIGAASVAIGAATLIGIGTAGAANTPGTLANKIATAFHLNAGDVQKVIDQNHGDQQAQRQQKLQDRLDQDVKDGKITSAQEKLILDKLASLKTERDSLKDKTPAERRTAMEQERTDLQQWAKDNNIPLQYLMPFGHGGMRGHMGMPDGGQPNNQ